MAGTARRLLLPLALAAVAAQAFLLPQQPLQSARRLPSARRAAAASTTTRMMVSAAAPGAEADADASSVAA